MILGWFRRVENWGGCQAATALTGLSELGLPDAWSDVGGLLPVLLAQADEGAGKVVAEVPAAGKPAAEGGGGLFDALFGSPMFPIMLTLMLLYFLFLRPDPKKKKEAEKLLANLKVNDHVVTIGGICGVVVSAPADSTTVTIRVDDKSGTKMRILRSAISRIGSPDEAAAEEAKEAK
jgi:preprotein translocase subunit YajC